MLSRVPLAMIWIAVYKTNENERGYDGTFSLEPFKFTSSLHLCAFTKIEHFDKSETAYVRWTSKGR